MQLKAIVEDEAFSGLPVSLQNVGGMKVGSLSATTISLLRANPNWETGALDMDTEIPADRVADVRAAAKKAVEIASSRMMD